MEEKISIDGIGIELVDDYMDKNNSLSFTLKPQTSKFIEIRATKQIWSVKSLVSYNIS